VRVLCVQCLKLNELPEDSAAAAGEDGKVRFPCPHCGFVTVVTRKKARQAAPPPPAAVVPRATPAPGRPKQDERSTVKQPVASLADELFDGSEKEVGDWMVRRLDGTEAGPLMFDELRQMIRDGDIGKIDEVRRMEERYVPAAFHELTAELFNELDMAGMSPPPKRG
jgi:hypothetical protein